MADQKLEIITRAGITQEERRNLVENLEQLLQESWFQSHDINHKVKRNFSDKKHFVLYIELMAIKSGKPIDYKLVREIAKVVKSSPDSLLGPVKSFSPDSQAFIDAAIRRNSTQEIIASETGIKAVRLRNVINHKFGCFNLEEAKTLHLRCQLPLHVITPFVAEEANIAANIVPIAKFNDAIQQESDWFYKRRAIKQLMQEQRLTIPDIAKMMKISVQKLREKILGDEIIYRVAHEMEPVDTKNWKLLLEKLGVTTEKAEKDLVLLGQTNNLLEQMGQTNLRSEEISMLSGDTKAQLKLQIRQSPLVNIPEPFFKRLGIQQLMKEKGISPKDLARELSLETLYVREDLLGEFPYIEPNAAAKPPEMERWHRLKALLGPTAKSEENLVLMGRYDLNRYHFNEFRDAEKILTQYVKENSGSTAIHEITSSEIYQFYLCLKHKWLTSSGKFSLEVIKTILQTISSRKFLTRTAYTFLISALQSFPALAKEIAFKYAIETLDEEARHSDNKYVKFSAHLKSSIFKLTFLLSEGLEGAAKTPFPIRSNFFYSLISLPIDMTSNFTYAQGYSKAIVNDWKEMINIITATSSFNKGVRLFNLRNYAEAMINFNRTIDLNPKHFQSYYYRGSCYQLQGDQQNAIKEFDLATYIHENYSQAYYQRGMAYLILGKNETALTDFKKAIAIEPNDHSAYYCSSQAHLGLNHFSEAMLDIKKALKIDSENKSYIKLQEKIHASWVDTLLNEGVRQLKLAKYAEAMHNLNKAIEIQPNHPSTYYFRSQAHLKLNHFSEAMLDIDKALESFAENKTYLNLQNKIFASWEANTLFNEGVKQLYLANYAEAMQNLNKAIEIKPNHPSTYYFRSQVHLKLNHFSEAMLDIDKALESYAENKTYLCLQDQIFASWETSTLFNEGVKSYHLANYADAMHKLNRAIEIDSNYHPAYYFRSQAHLKLNHFSEAMLDIDKALESFAENKTYLNLQNRIFASWKASTLFNEGVKLFNLAYYAEAIHNLNSAIEIKPNHPPAYYFRSQAHLKLNHFSEAMLDIDKALESFSENKAYLNLQNRIFASWKANTLFNEGVKQFNLAYYAEAIHNLNSAIEIKPNHPPAYYFRSQAHLKLNHFSEAMLDIDKALESFAENKTYLNLQNRIFASWKASTLFNEGVKQFNLAYYAEAIHNLNSAIEIKPNHPPAYYFRSQAHLKLNHFSEAMLDIDKALESFAENKTYLNLQNKIFASWEASTLFNEGVKLYNLANYAEAIHNLDKAIEINPNHTSAYYFRSQAHLKLNHFSEAMLDIDKALESFAENKTYLNLQDQIFASWEASTLFNEGVKLYNLLNFAEAMNYFNRAIDLNSKHFQSYYYRGCCYQMQGDPQNAINEFNLTTQINEDYFWAYKQRGLAYLTLGENETALTNLNKAVEIEPNHAPNYHFRSQALFNLNYVSEAMLDINNALKSDPTSHELLQKTLDSWDEKRNQMLLQRQQAAAAAQAAQAAAAAEVAAALQAAAQAAAAAEAAALQAAQEAAAAEVTAVLQATRAAEAAAAAQAGADINAAIVAANKRIRKTRKRKHAKAIINECQQFSKARHHAWQQQQNNFYENFTTQTSQILANRSTQLHQQLEKISRENAERNRVAIERAKQAYQPAIKQFQNQIVGADKGLSRFGIFGNGRKPITVDRACGGNAETNPYYNSPDCIANRAILAAHGLLKG